MSIFNESSYTCPACSSKLEITSHQKYKCTYCNAHWGIKFLVEDDVPQKVSE